MKAPATFALALCAFSVGACRSVETTPSVGVVAQEDMRAPQAWRTLTEDEQSIFDLGYSVFNTGWAPANSPAGRRDGLGPLFNSQSCDSCHNSRRRGRGPRRDGDAPNDLVVQLGRRLPDGEVKRGTDEYGYVLNTSAIEGMKPEARVRIDYSYSTQTLPDGIGVDLFTPIYKVTEYSGTPLPDSAVLMPRVSPSVQGLGLLELVPQSHLEMLAAKNGGVISWVDTPQGTMAGRFGWQATEPTVATQTATAFSREMGLTTSLVPHIDCGKRNTECWRAPNGGTPEVELELFGAVVHFVKLHAVPTGRTLESTPAGERLFESIGCGSCHQATLPVAHTATNGVIHAYTDLLLHDLGEGLADRDLANRPVRSKWRTAPLWGMNASVTSGQPLRLLHDGRARSITEAILWHGGEATAARDSFANLSAQKRRAIEYWISDR